MANEYEDLATVNTDGAVVTVSRMYQEDGGRGLEIVVSVEGKIRDVFQTRDLVPRTTTGPKA